MVRKTETTPTCVPRPIVLLSVVWMPVAIATLCARAASLDAAGYRLLAESVGRTTSPDVRPFRVLEMLSFYRADLFWSAVVIPLAVLALAKVLPRAAVATVTALAGSVVLVMLYTQTELFGTIGRFQSVELIMDGWHWGSDNPGIAGQYAYPERFAALGAVVVGVWLIAWYVARRGRCVENRPATSASKGSGEELSPSTGAPAEALPISPGDRYFARCATAALYLGGAAALGSWMIPIESTAWHRSLYAMYYDGFADAPDPIAEVGTASAEEIEAFDRRFPDTQHVQRVHLGKSEPTERTAATLGRNDAEPFGRCDDYDVILFVMETVPALCMPADDALDDMPHVARLRSRSLVARRHLTTYACTNRALVSLVSSWYPSASAKMFIQQHPDIEFPGLLRRLAERGYVSAVYSPSRLSLPDDRRMFHALGFDHIHEPTSNDALQAASETTPYWKIQERMDEEMLAKCERDLGEWIDRNRRYVVMYLPQFGHAPWPDVTGEHPDRSLIERGRAVVAVQDAWVGRIVKRLAERGRLEKTIIVVTADHGLRNVVEDPTLRLHTASERTFHVPLLVYAPGAFAGRRDVRHVTSHIDVAPTILRLMGIDPGPSAQGTALWDERLAERTTFFWSRHCLGVDGFHRRGEYAYRDAVLDITAVADRLTFTPAHILARNGTDARTVTRRLFLAAAGQRRLVEKEAARR
jgi:hypothetical protein